jgi:transcriptional regulator with XRE-family HTH domain
LGKPALRGYDGDIEAPQHRVAVRITGLRKFREMSQRQLAEACGMTRDAITAIESGRRAIKLAEAIAISAALGIELGALVSPEPLVVHVAIPID